MPSSNKSKEERPTLWYPIIHPKTGEEVWPEEHAVWRYSKERHRIMEEEARLYWGPDQSYRKPRLKRFLSEVQDGIVPPTWWEFKECGHNDEAQKETAALLAPKVFSTPKPLRLLERILTVGTNDDSIVLDFFAGSGSTAHSVLLQNSKDGGKRRFILVQLPEMLSDADNTQRTAAEFCRSIKKPTLLSEITKERVRRATSKIKADSPMFSGDLGFRVYKLDTSNIRPWDPDRENIKGTLDEYVDNIKDDRTEDDILTELLLKLGLDLTVPIQTKEFSREGAKSAKDGKGKKGEHFAASRDPFQVHSIGGGVLIVCLSPHISRDDVEPLAHGIVEWHQSEAPAGESTVVFRDSAFADDVAKTNLTAILQQHGLDNVRSL